LVILLANAAGRDKEHADTVRELKVLKAEQAQWSKEKKALESQVSSTCQRASQAWLFVTVPW
jgi:hypothetical protein